MIPHVRTTLCAHHKSSYCLSPRGVPSIPGTLSSLNCKPGSPARLRRGWPVPEGSSWSSPGTGQARGHCPQDAVYTEGTLRVSPPEPPGEECSGVDTCPGEGVGLGGSSGDEPSMAAQAQSTTQRLVSRCDATDLVTVAGSRQAASDWLVHRSSAQQAETTSTEVDTEVTEPQTTH